MVVVVDVVAVVVFVVAAGEADGPAACTSIKGELSLVFDVGFAG